MKKKTRLTLDSGELYENTFFNLKRIELIFRLGSPVFLGMLVGNLVNFTDNFMVANMDRFIGDRYPHLVNDAANGLAAMGPAGLLTQLVAGLFASINIGTQALVSRRDGEKNHAAAGNMVYNSMAAGFVTGWGATLLSVYFLIPAVFPLFHGNPEVVRLGMEFCFVRFFSIPGWVMTFGVKGFWDGIGRTHVYMMAAMVMAVTNAIFNYFIMYGFEPLGLAPQGVAGAAWGSTLSTYFGLGFVVYWLGKQKYRQKYAYRRMGLHWPAIKSIMKISLPSGLGNIVLVSAFLFFVKLAGLLDDKAMVYRMEANLDGLLEKTPAQLVESLPAGVRAHWKPGEKEKLKAAAADLKTRLTRLRSVMRPLAKAALEDGSLFFNPPRDKMSRKLKAFLKEQKQGDLEALLRPIQFNSNGAATTIILSIAMISFIGVFGFGQGAATLVGQSMGRGRADIARKFGFEAIGVLSVIYVIPFFIFLVWPELPVGIFTSDPVVTATALGPIRVWAFAMLLIPPGVIFPQCLFATGQSMYVMKIQLVVHFICLVPVTWFLSIYLDWGVTGLWAAAVIYLGILTVFMGLRFAGDRWGSAARI